MQFRFLGVSILILTSVLVAGIFIGIAECADSSILWTTNASGTAEVDQFSIGDTIYIKTSGSARLNNQKSKYMVYILAGNFLHEGVTNPPYPDLNSFPKPLNFVPFEIVTDNDGKLPNPLPIWSHATFGEFTVVLDYLGHYDGESFILDGAHRGSFDTAGNQADFRDDICSSADKLPSFHVVPEPATVLAGVMMFGAFASFLLIKRKNMFFK